MSWMTDEHLTARGFRKIGRGCKISVGADIIGHHNIEIGDNVRIDTGVVILAGSPDAWLRIGSHVHIASRAILSCGGGVDLGDFTTIGMGSTLVSASDSFSGDHLVGPVFDSEFTKVTKSPIMLEAHAIVTTGCVLLPGARMREGSVLGAMALLKGEAEEWKVYAGVPAKARQQRSRKAIELGAAWEKTWASRQP